MVAWSELRSRHRFSLLLGMLLLLALAAPFVNRVATGVLFLAMLVSVVNAVAPRRRTVVVALGLAALLMALWVAGLAVPGRGIEAATVALAMVVLGYAVALVARFVFAGRRVTWNTIAGAGCLYVLLGVLWAHVYSLMELASPGSFCVAGAPADAPGLQLTGLGSPSAL